MRGVLFSFVGKVRKKQVKYYPDEYKDCIGKSYNDYVQTKQMNIFEFLDGYVGQSYADLPKEASKQTSDAEKVEAQTEIK